MKGIILAGGSGSRLYPTTRVISKQLLPIYDKPMIYYSLSVLMLTGIRDILLISTPRDIELYRDLLRDGSHLGLSIQYKIQEKPNGVAEAFIIGEDFIKNDTVALILGDNIFYGQSFSQIIQDASKSIDGATIFGYYVKNPSLFGVVEIDKETKKPISIEEKPPFPKSKYAIPGLYFYDNKVSEYVRNISPSSRGELEITDLNREYLRRGKLKVELFGRGLSWFDSGTEDGLLEASNFVKAVQESQGLYIACIEEIAYRMNFIDKTQLLELAKEYKNSKYGRYIQGFFANDDFRNY